MWTNVIDETALGLCRSMTQLAGHLPSACQVDAGRPVLYLALVCTLAVAIVAKSLFDKTRRISS